LDTLNVGESCSLFMQLLAGLAAGTQSDRRLSLAAETTGTVADPSADVGSRHKPKA
jgi:hypothetical protein